MPWPSWKPREGPVSEAGETRRLLGLADRLRGPAVASAVEALCLPPGGHGLDVGCGMGSQMEALVEASAPGGKVTGLDPQGEHLAAGRCLTDAAGISDRVSFRRGAAEALPFEADSFDWAWSVDCVGFIPGNPVEMLREMARVVRQGGTVALLLWSSQQLLPGYPFLEARLNGTRAGAAPAEPHWPPERHPLRALGWLTEAGLRGPAARTFLTDLASPFLEEEREALLALMEMRWGDPGEELPDADVATFRMLTDRSAPESIVDRDDYFGFFTYTLFWGRV